MNATTIGANIKYVLPVKGEISLVAGGNTTISGRNMGQSGTVYGSIFYVFNFNKKVKTTDQPVNSK